MLKITLRLKLQDCFDIFFFYGINVTTDFLLELKDNLMLKIGFYFEHNSR